MNRGDIFVYVFGIQPHDNSPQSPVLIFPHPEYIVYVAVLTVLCRRGTIHMCGEDILRLLPIWIWCMVEKLRLDYARLWEIRLRVNSPFILRYEDAEIYVNGQGQRADNMKNAYIVTARDVNDTLECVCNHSLYAYEDEIRQGFVTVCGGHRVGVAGKIILDGTRIKCIRHISFLNIRVAHEIKGCSKPVLPYIYADDRNGILFDITKILSEANINVNSINSRTSKQGKATFTISFAIKPKEQLNTIIAKIRNVDSIIDIERTTG